MTLNKYITVILVLIASLVCSSQAVLQESSFQEKWHGNCLWVASQQNPKIPAGWVDSAKWIATFPGSWDLPMASFIISSPASAGVQNIYWDVYNSNGMLLYPSELFSEKVYKNPNSGYDFLKTDMAAIASSTAMLDNVNLKYTVWWNDGLIEPAIVKELVNKYPRTNIAVVSPQPSHSLIKQKLSDALSQKQMKSVEIIEPQLIEKMIDLTACDKDPLKSHDFHKGLIHKYLHFGKVIFKREIVSYEEGKRCTIAVSGRNKWHLFVNGKFVSTGSWKNGTWQDMAFLSGTYEITELIKPGKNVIAVCVESGYNERAFMANIRFGDMIYRCDDNWKAMCVKNLPSEENIEQLCSQQDNWQTPMKLARPNIWPNFMGKVYWHRLYPWQDELEK